MDGIDVHSIWIQDEHKKEDIRNSSPTINSSNLWTYIDLQVINCEKEPDFSRTKYRPLMETFWNITGKKLTIASI